MDMAWYIPLLIFGARIVDVSIGTVRMIFLVSGSRFLAAGLGFVEVIVWVLAVGGAISFLHKPIALLAYAGGFAAGTLVGVEIERRLAIGYRIIRVINSKADLDVSGHLREAGYRVTRIDGFGMRGPVEIAFLVVRRRVLRDVIGLIERFAPEAFLSVERADRATGAAFTNPDRLPWGRLGLVRK
jgi:uncharacterized protein YebE (UPF0316 family)